MQQRNVNTENLLRIYIGMVAVWRNSIETMWKWRVMLSHWFIPQDPVFVISNTTHNSRQQWCTTNNTFPIVEYRIKKRRTGMWQRSNKNTKKWAYLYILDFLFTIFSKENHFQLHLIQMTIDKLICSLYLRKLSPEAEGLGKVVMQFQSQRL